LPVDEEIANDIAQGYADGRFRAPRRAGLTHMLSTKNRVFHGEKLVSYPSHVMIMTPFVTNADIGADFSNRYLPWVLNEGKPSAYIMIVTDRSETE